MTRELLEALKDGEPTAFVELVMVYTVKLRRIAMTFFKNPFEQEEALQETFLHIFRQRATIDPSRADEFEGFVTTLARRKMIDILRAIHPKQALGVAATAGMESPPNPHQIAETRDLEQIMSRFGIRPSATAYSPFQEVRVEAWVEPGRGVPVRRGLFIAQVAGSSMEPSIADGAFCVFARPWPSPQPREAGIFMLSDSAEPEGGGRFTLKEYAPRKVATAEGSRIAGTLKARNPRHRGLRPSGQTERPFARLVRVLR